MTWRHTALSYLVAVRHRRLFKLIKIKQPFKKAMRILEKKLDSDLGCSVTPVTLADLSSHMRLVRHVDSADIERGS